MLSRVTDSICLVFFFSSRRRHTRFDCDWSSDVCSSDLLLLVVRRPGRVAEARGFLGGGQLEQAVERSRRGVDSCRCVAAFGQARRCGDERECRRIAVGDLVPCERHRSEEHTSELQSQSNLVCRLLLEKKTKR